MTPSKFIGLALISFVLTIILLWSGSKALEGKGCVNAIFVGIVIFAVVFAMLTLLTIGILFLVQ